MAESPADGSPVARSLGILRARLDEVFAAEAGTLEASLRAAVDAARAAATAEAEAGWERQLATVHADAEARLERELEAAAASADTRIATAVADALAAATADAAAVPDVSAQLARMQAAFERMGAATSLTDILTTTLAAAQAEAPRAVIALLEHGRPRPWRSAGMPLPDDLDEPAASLVAEVLRTGQTAAVAGAGDRRTDGTDGSETGGGTGSATELTWAGALTVDGQAVAVLLIEEGRADAPASLEALRQAASLCLTSLTVRRTTSAVRFVGRPAAAGADSEQESARRFARLVVSEIKLYHEAAVREGRTRRDLAARLAPEIARARHAFEVRVPASLPGREGLFHDELVQVLAGGEPALLGHQVS